MSDKLELEACIKYFKECIDLIEPYGNYAEVTISRRMCERVIEVLEKQIPKKPGLYEWDTDNHQFTEVCPNCGDTWNMNEFGSGMEYCWSCGQKIDWSEEE